VEKRAQKRFSRDSPNINIKRYAFSNALLVNKLKYAKQALMITFIQFYDKLYNITYLNYIVYSRGCSALYAVGHILFTRNLAGRIRSKNMHVGILNENSVFIFVIVLNYNIYNYKSFIPFLVR